MRTREATYKSVGFFHLICDASFAYFRAKSQESSYEQNRYARFSILSSALSIESFANCLVEGMSLSKSQLSKLDRLPTLAKIDEYLKFLGAERLHRGEHEVEKVSELIRARNDFVHIRTSRTEAQVSPAALQSVDTPRYDALLDPETHPSLGIFKVGAFWHADEAQVALQAVSEFLRYVMGLVEDEHGRSIRNSLVSTFEAGGISVAILPEDYVDELGNLKGDGIDFTFLVDDS